MQIAAMTMTDLDENQRRRVAPLIRAGLGAEDIAVKTGLAEGAIRDCVRYWRRSGFLNRVMWGV